MSEEVPVPPGDNVTEDGLIVVVGVGPGEFDCETDVAASVTVPANELTLVTVTVDEADWPGNIGSDVGFAATSKVGVAVEILHAVKG